MISHDTLIEIAAILITIGGFCGLFAVVMVLLSLDQCKGNRMRMFFLSIRSHHSYELTDAEVYLAFNRFLIFCWTTKCKHCGDTTIEFGTTSRFDQKVKFEDAMKIPKFKEQAEAINKKLNGFAPLE